MLVRHAARFDAPRICTLLNRYSQDAGLLPRTQAEICAAIHTFLLAEDDHGRLLGCCSLHRYDESLAEVRSMVVRTDRKGNGIGSTLLQALLDEAQAASIADVCLFTRNPGFFRRHGFVESSVDLFPKKQEKDCRHCTRRNCCDEVAMVWSAAQTDENGLSGALSPELCLVIQ